MGEEEEYPSSSRRNCALLFRRRGRHWPPSRRPRTSLRSPSLLLSLSFPFPHRYTNHTHSPGYTYTGLTGAPASGGGETPPGAWTAEETVRFMLERVARGDFYVLCPDGETGREIDQLHIMWAAADVAQGRPALSRWHRDYKALFEEYMREGKALAQEGARGLML
ncbi:hypothetical protein C8R46DRAFT_999391 [Mycena filopes]|nr:hypothetical protein C8R46DRAFT_999391 [Mycena filopes]